MGQYKWTERSEEQARFEQHLRWASEEVKSWPLWKQNLWRGGPNRPLATEVIPKPNQKCHRCGGPRPCLLNTWGDAHVFFSYPITS